MSIIGFSKVYVSVTFMTAAIGAKHTKWRSDDRKSKDRQEQIYTNEYRRGVSGSFKGKGI